MLEKRRAFEEKKFRLQQEELRLNLEAEMVKKIAKERVYAAMSTPSLPELKPLKLETELQDQDPPAASPRTRKSFSGVVHHPGQGVSADSAPYCQFDHQAFIANENMRKETIGLQRQQTALQFQQNRIMELLAHNQNRSKLPQPRVPVFDGNPIEYRTFVRAFESLVESRTLSSTDRLYYLEQFTAGDVKELVRSCHHLPSEEGYDEARRLLRRKYGDDYRIASAYEMKALNWPSIKAEDGIALNRFFSLSRKLQERVGR